MALRNMMTAAFGNGTATTLPTLPVMISVDEHPDLLRHQRQRDELAGALATATDDVSRLQRERVQADRDVQEAAVRQLLGDDLATVTPDAEARLSAADAAIVRAQVRIATINEALRRLDSRGADLRNAILCEIRERVEAAARDVVKKLAKTLRDASALNDELAMLERFERYDAVAVPVRHWHELSRLNEYSRPNQWLGAAQAAGLDV